MQLPQRGNANRPSKLFKPLPLNDLNKPEKEPRDRYCFKNTKMLFECIRVSFVFADMTNLHIQRRGYQPLYYCLRAQSIGLVFVSKRLAIPVVCVSTRFRFPIVTCDLSSFAEEV